MVHGKRMASIAYSVSDSWRSYDFVYASLVNRNFAAVIFVIVAFKKRVGRGGGRGALNICSEGQEEEKCRSGRYLSWLPYHVRFIGGIRGAD